MKQLSIFISIVLLSIWAWSCADEVGDYTVKGEAITKYELITPKSNDSIVINPGALDETVVFSWNEAESGLESPIKYTLIFYKEGGDFENPIWSKESDVEGSNNKATLTFTELMEVYSAGKESSSDEVRLLWTVKSDNGSYNIKSAQVSNLIKIWLSEDGLSNFMLSTPADNSLFSLNGSLEDELLSFAWEEAISTNGNDVTYQLLIDELSGDFSDPILSVNSDNQGADKKVEKTQGEWKLLFQENNIEDGAYKWTVIASTSGIIWSNEIYTMYVEFINWRKPIYIVGEATTAGWDINNALEMSFVSPNLWTAVLELNDTKEFKFFPVVGSWDNGIGAESFTDFINCQAVDNGNIKVTTGKTGEYIVVVDLNSKMLSVFEVPYLVGGSTVVGWSIDNPYPLSRIEKGLFETYEYLTVDGSGFKFLTTKDWKGDFGKSKTTDGILAQADENNIEVESNGFYRIRANYNDMTYLVESVSWGIIGSATPGGWDSSTPMVFTNVAKGEYKWAVDVSLISGDVKFRANDAWTINLGDNDMDGTMEYGGANIPVTVGGNYHIELILNSQTGYSYSITAN